MARVCQVSPATVAHWIDQGHLKGHKTPTGRRRVATADLVAFLKSHGMPVPPELRGEQPRAAVVVVDDDDTYRHALVRTLERDLGDVELVAVATGVDGLMAIGRVNPAVIVLDYTLPDLNAVQVVERLLEPKRALPAEVVVITGGLPEGAAERLYGVGLRVVVNKADGMGAVVEAIRAALRRRVAA